MLENSPFRGLRNAHTSNADSHDDPVAHLRTRRVQPSQRSGNHDFLWNLALIPIVWWRELQPSRCGDEGRPW
jgi:hypothetical protein